MRIDFKKIYIEREALNNYTDIVHGILNKYPDAVLVVVDRHDKIDQLREAKPDQWLDSKINSLVLGVRKSFKMTPNNNSSDFIPPTHSTGCLSSCNYCYVSRHRGGSNPLTIYVNYKDIGSYIESYFDKLGPKSIGNQQHDSLWMVDIGCNNDCSLDAFVCDAPTYLVNRFSNMEYAGATFATKTVNEKAWLNVDPKGHTRIRYSIMPQYISSIVDVRTSTITARLLSSNRLLQAGYEIHFNFSPIIVYEGTKWVKDWIELFEQMNDVLSNDIKKQAACEVIFLTHSAMLHQVNLEWNERAESYLWNPELQHQKRDKPDVICYDYKQRRLWMDLFKALIAKYIPWCRLRYMI